MLAFFYPLQPDRDPLDATQFDRQTQKTDVLDPNLVSHRDEFTYESVFAVQWLHQPDRCLARSDLHVRAPHLRISKHCLLLTQPYPERARQFEVDHYPQRLDKLNTRRRGKIGRASCRERG